MACTRRISTTPGDGSKGLDFVNVFLRNVSIIHGVEMTRRVKSDILGKMSRLIDGHSMGVCLTGKVQSCKKAAERVQ
jgi:hypothetical protein